MRGVLTASAVTILLWSTSAAQAQPSADQVLTDVKIAEADKQRVLKGEFVSATPSDVSDRDIAVAIVFLAKPSPDALVRQLLAGNLAKADPQVKALGTLSGDGALADLAALKISADEAKALARAKPGAALNLGTQEIAALGALTDTDRDGVQKALHELLLARYRAYRAAGLEGITPYDRGGRITDAAGDLRKATDSVTVLKKHIPAFHAAVLGYPRATAPRTAERFAWTLSDVNGKPAYILTHVMAAAEGDARVIVQRQYYVSSGYNAEQAVMSASCPSRAGPSSSTSATPSPIRSRASAAP